MHTGFYQNLFEYYKYLWIASSSSVPGAYEWEADSEREKILWKLRKVLFTKQEIAPNTPAS